MNLVDADAAAELASYMAKQATALPLSVNLFLKYYVEQYDFLYLISDHDLATGLAGESIRITSPAMPGTGLDYDYEATGYTTNGRIRGLIGIDYFPQFIPPFPHEFMHYWANFLSPDLGFRVGLNEDHGPHWGYAAFDGVLGGFDGTTLRCANPANAMPPACTPETSGRIRYDVASFSPEGWKYHPFAPLELYLMGVLPEAELPTTFSVLTEGALVANDTLVEASGIKTFPATDIFAKHGHVEPLPADERAFTAAFVVVSATPAPDAVLDEIGTAVAVFGNRASDPNGQSLEACTGGRVTMDTRLGPRRLADAAPPAVRIPKTCDILAQDCGVNRACFFRSGAGTCGVTRGGQSDETCEQDSDCSKGLGCATNQTSGAHACEPYCSANGADANACFTLCSSHYFLANADNIIVAGTCEPPP